MREKLNSNPVYQLAVIGVLLVVGAIFVFSTMGRSGEEETSESPISATSAVAGEGPAPSPTAAPPETAGTLPGGQTLATRPLPGSVVSAWNANRTVVLLFVHDGGIDDKLVKQASGILAAMPDVSVSVVPAGEIARYAAITESLGVDRVPALVVLRPKHLDQSVPTGTVSYGFQDTATIVQAVVDAGYKGPTLEYHP